MTDYPIDSWVDNWDEWQNLCKKYHINPYKEKEIVIKFGKTDGFTIAYMGSFPPRNKNKIRKCLTFDL